LALIGVPLSIYLSLFSEEIIFFIFGHQWVDAIQPFKILSTTVWVQMTLSSTGTIFQARNKTKHLLSTGIITAIILVTSTVIGVMSNNLNIMALCLTIGFYVNFFINFNRVMTLALESNLLTLLIKFKIPFLI